MGKVNEESSTGGLGIPNPLSIKYEDEEYVKEVANHYLLMLLYPKLIVMVILLI